jgi:predicted CXXCH cytochrome family protein
LENKKEEWMGSVENRRMLFIVLAGIFLSFLSVSKAIAAKYDRIVASPVIEGAEYAGTESCVSCHPQEAKEFARSTHAKYDINEDNPQGQGCEICHGPGSKHNEVGGIQDGLTYIINPKRDPQTCFPCHPEKLAEFKLQFHHPVLEGKMSCVDCHDVMHGEETLPWTVSSIEVQNEKCFKCHQDKMGPYAYEHEALREGCSICHNSHGSIDRQLLVARDNNICERCHSEMPYPRLGDFNHASLTPRGKENCWDCHSQVHGANFSTTFIFE